MQIYHYNLYEGDYVKSSIYYSSYSPRGLFLNGTLTLAPIKKGLYEE